MPTFSSTSEPLRDVVARELEKCRHLGSDSHDMASMVLRVIDDWVAERPITQISEPPRSHPWLQDRIAASQAKARGPIGGVTGALGPNQTGGALGRDQTRGVPAMSAEELTAQNKAAAENDDQQANRGRQIQSDQLAETNRKAQEDQNVHTAQKAEADRRAEGDHRAQAVQKAVQDAKNQREAENPPRRPPGGASRS